MKRVFAAICVLTLLVTVTGCAKKNDGGGLILDETIVSNSVKGWVVYTNPAFRYELRYPQTWTFKDSGEDGTTANFMPIDATSSQLTIKSYTNWSQNFTLEQFYLDKKQDFFKTMKQEDIDIGGMPSKLIRAMTGRVDGAPEKIVDLIMVNLGDRILEIELRDTNEVSKTVLSSIKFYGNNSKSDLQ